MDILFLYVTIEQEYGKKDRKSNYEKTTKLCRYHKGSTDPDRCGSDHCGSSLFLSGAEPYICKQYLRSWYRTIKLCTLTTVCDHHDFECGTSDHWLYHLRTRIWCKNGLHQYRSALISRIIREIISGFWLYDQ